MAARAKRAKRPKKAPPAIDLERLAEDIHKPGEAGARAAWRLQKLIQHDPIWAARRLYGINLWEKQREGLRMIWDHPRVGCQAGNNVGKSYFAATAVHIWMSAWPDAKVVTTANTWAQVESVLWSEIATQHANAPIPIGGRMLKTEFQPNSNMPGWVALGLSTNRSDSFVGRHAEHLLVIFDEAQGIEASFWEAAETLASSAGCRILAIGNPVRRSGQFYDVCRGKVPGWKSLRISCLDHPNIVHGRDPKTGQLPIPAAVSPEYVEGKRLEWGEDSPTWIARIEGRFPPASERALVPEDLLDRQAHAIVEGLPGRRLGVDVARHGSDSNVGLLLIDGRVAAVHRWRERDLMKTAGLVVRLMQRWEVAPRLTGIDVGMGAGVIDRLRELGHPVCEIDFGGKGGLGAEGMHAQLVGEDRRFLNARSRYFWTIRAMLEANMLSIPRRWEKLWQDLGALEYDYNEADALFVTSKKQLREMLGRSIDDADALVCAIAAGQEERERGPRFAFPAA